MMVVCSAQESSMLSYAARKTVLLRLDSPRFTDGDQKIYDALRPFWPLAVLSLYSL